MTVCILYFEGISEEYLKLAPHADILIQEWKSSDALSFGKGQWYATRVGTAVEDVVFIYEV